MASAQVPSTVMIKAAMPDGRTKIVYTNSVSVAAPGGSPDGVIATTVPPSEWAYFENPGVILDAGFKIQFIIIPNAAATLDASDAAWSIPASANKTKVALNNSANGYLGTDALQVDKTFTDGAVVASQENVVAIYSVKAGNQILLGGGNIFYGYEDNAS